MLSSQGGSIMSENFLCQIALNLNASDRRHYSQNLHLTSTDLIIFLGKNSWGNKLEQ